MRIAVIGATGMVGSRMFLNLTGGSRSRTEYTVACWAGE